MRKRCSDGLVSGIGFPFSATKEEWCGAASQQCSCHFLQTTKATAVKHSSSSIFKQAIRKMLIRYTRINIAAQS